MGKRLTGAALYNRVIAECRRMLADDYGLPMGEYTARMEAPYSLGSDMQPILEVTFTRESNGAVVTATNIHPSDDGSLDQFNLELR